MVGFLKRLENLQRTKNNNLFAAKIPEYVHIIHLMVAYLPSGPCNLDNVLLHIHLIKFIDFSLSLPVAIYRILLIELTMYLCL